MTASADIIDLLAGIAPGDPLTAVRDQRAQARENAQRSFEALRQSAAALDKGTQHGHHRVCADPVTLCQVVDDFLPLRA